MIIVELAGGLGNQMFQYAFGIATAERTNSKLFLDQRFLEIKDQPAGFTLRDYELDIFGVSNQNILPSNLFSKATKLQGSLKAKLFRKIAPQFSTYIKEDSKKFHPEYLKTNKEVYLRGYWQNPRYFDDYKEVILKAFEFQKGWSSSGKEFADQIAAQPQAISIHVRRGDYLKNPFNLKVCNQEYYQKSIEHFKEINGHYFIFSDEPKWVLENFDLKSNCTVVDRKGSPETNYEDFRLMSLCHHHIIANSSFSWWGAYLNNKPNKKVIAPKLWDQLRSSKDVCPSEWILY